jgi:hypothetical protein
MEILNPSHLILDKASKAFDLVHYCVEELFGPLLSLLSFFLLTVEVPKAGSSMTKLKGTPSVIGMA